MCKTFLPTTLLLLGFWASVLLSSVTATENNSVVSSESDKEYNSFIMNLTTPPFAEAQDDSQTDAMEIPESGFALGLFTVSLVWTASLKQPK